MQVCFLFLLYFLEPDRSVQSKGGKVGGLTQGWQRKNSTQWGRGWGLLKAAPLSWCQRGCQRAEHGQGGTEFASREMLCQPLNNMTLCLRCLCMSDSPFHCFFSIPSIPLPCLSVWHGTIILTSFVSLLLSLAAVCIVRSVFYLYSYFVWSTLIRDT